MTPASLKAAIHHAEEFLRRAKAVPSETVAVAGYKPWQRVQPGKRAAAAKRASLDLTRALADMRRGGE